MNKKDKIICLCNGIALEKIKQAIVKGGARSIDEIFDLSMAGVGGCGGSCRPQLKDILKNELKTLEKNTAKD